MAGALLTVSDLSNMAQGTCAAPPTCSRCRRSARTWTSGRPVAIGLLAVLHFVPDAHDPAGAVACLRDAVAPGSYLTISRIGTEFFPDKAAMAQAKTVLGDRRRR
jgi:hypothetical protein